MADENAKTGTLLDGVEGEFDPVSGRFKVSNWPKPRVSNPNFLTEEFEKFEAEERSRREAEAESDAPKP